MAIKDVLKKLFAQEKENAIEHYDQWGQPIRGETIDEMRLRRYREREHKQKVRNLLDYYDKKHTLETSPFNAYKFYKKKKKY